MLSLCEWNAFCGVCWICACSYALRHRSDHKSGCHWLKLRSVLAFLYGYWALTGGFVDMYTWCQFACGNSPRSESSRHPPPPNKCPQDRLSRLLGMFQSRVFLPQLKGRMQIVSIENTQQCFQCWDLQRGIAIYISTSQSPWEDIGLAANFPNYQWKFLRVHPTAATEPHKRWGWEVHLQGETWISRRINP